MGSNLVAMHFRRELDSSIVKACFDALKQNKETEKYQKTNYILNEDELPKINQL